MKLWLKACPKCAGDLILKQDFDGAYVECIQCGDELTLAEELFLARLGYVPDGMSPIEAPQVMAEGRRHSA
jgi:hypothetical protein